MRTLLALFLLSLGLTAQAAGQACTGLCLQQVTCPGNGTTTVTGVVTVPNGVDPLPNATVYIPNAPVEAFTGGVSCPVVGQVPSGSPLSGTSTAVDGSFILTNVPVGTNIPLVVQSGRWRRQVVIPATTACANTNLDVSLPGNRSQGDIPHIAVVSGSQDTVECVLRKIGIADSEFTDATGPGRINIYPGSGISPAGAFPFVLGAGANPPSGPTTSDETALMRSSAALNQYDVLMLPCQGGEFLKSSTELQNLANFANAGGRVYSSHYSYTYLFRNGPFANVVDWFPNQPPPPDGTATVNQSFPEGQTLAQWLQITQASTIQGQIPINTLRQDFNRVIAPTQTWLTLNNPNYGNPVMQFVFDTPIAAPNQCGRVLFNEYHVEQPLENVSNVSFPSECTSTAGMSAQEKLLEYSLFELTGDGGLATLSPTAEDFGPQPLTSNSSPFLFTWTNNSTFLASVSGVNIISTTSASTDFTVSSNNCGAVAAAQSCQIGVVFTPTVLGPRSAKLIVGSSGQTLTATLSGTGVPDLKTSVASLNFGSLPVGNSVTQTFSLTNQSSNTPVPAPLFSISGDYSFTTNCGATLSPLSSCTIRIVFTPAALGQRAGTLSATSPNQVLTVALSGVGLTDFVLSQPSLTFGSLDVGASASQTLKLTNQAAAAVALPALAITGDYAVSTTCGPVVAALSTCNVTVTFTPTIFGPRPGTIGVNSGAAAYAGIPGTLSGNGVDFTMADTPASGQVVAGFSSSTSVVTTPLAGFAAPLTLTCSTDAAASLCTPLLLAFTPASPVADQVTISTTAQYAVVGYGGLGGSGLLAILGVSSGGLLLINRRRFRALLGPGLLALLLAAGAFSISGCSGQYPAQNPTYTKPGSYRFTVAATDGFLIHSATYTLVVTAK